METGKSTSFVRQYEKSIILYYAKEKKKQSFACDLMRCYSWVLFICFTRQKIRFYSKRNQ